MPIKTVLQQKPPELIRMPRELEPLPEEWGEASDPIIFHKVFSNEVRVAIYDTLCHRRLGQHEIIKLISQRFNHRYRPPTIIEHLNLMERAGVITSEREGWNKFYRRAIDVKVLIRPHSKATLDKPQTPEDLIEGFKT